MKKIALILALLLIAIIVFSGCGQPPQPPVPIDVTLPISQRNFEMGFVPIPKQPVNADSLVNAFQVMKGNSDFVMHYVPVDWTAFADSESVERSASVTPNLENTNFVALMARQNNLKVAISIEPTRADHMEIDDKLPAGFGKNFGDEKVRSAFKNFAVRIAKDYKPEYLGLTAEENSYMKNHPEDADNLISLISETSALVKKESPNTKIIAAFQFEVLNGKANGSAQWDLLEKIEPVVDAVAITTYPALYFESPAKIPDDYYSQLKQYTQKPIVIAESGWPSGGNASYHGSQESQNNFLVRMTELTKNINLKLWVWWFLHDWAGPEYPDYFGTMGLRTSNGEEKQSWQVWQKIHALPLK